MPDLKKLFKDAAESVQGLSEDLRPVAFRFFLEQGVNDKVKNEPHRAARKTRKKAQLAEATKSQKKPGSSSSPTSPKALDMKVDLPKLRQYTSSKNPKGHDQQYAVLAKFLRDQKLADRVGQDEIYTCYKILHWRAPNHMEQIFHNARNRKGLFTVRGDDNKFALTHIGEQFVEHDLPADKMKGTKGQ